MNRRGGIVHGDVGGDLVLKNFGLVRGGAGIDRVRYNGTSGTFYGGAGRDTVKTNKGRFIRGPQ